MHAVKAYSLLYLFHVLSLREDVPFSIPRDQFPQLLLSAHFCERLQSASFGQAVTNHAARQTDGYSLLLVNEIFSIK